MQTFTSRGIRRLTPNTFPCRHWIIHSNAWPSRFMDPLVPEGCKFLRFYNPGVLFYALVSDVLANALKSEWAKMSSNQRKQVTILASLKRLLRSRMIVSCGSRENIKISGWNINNEKAVWQLYKKISGSLPNIPH